ncbi:MAG: cytochrome c3 family protein [Burkholderiaceae bacterium]
MQGKTIYSFMVAGLMVLAFVAGASSAMATPGSAALSGVPIKDHHFKAMGAALECKTCHQVALPTTRPADDKACISCHGPMGDIKTEKNANGKYPHQSHHYEDLLQCMACHSEHKPSRALCNDCHTVVFPKLK